MVLEAAHPLPYSAFRSRQEPLWLPAGVLAALMMLAMAISASGAEVGPASAAGGTEKVVWRPIQFAPPADAASRFKPANRAAKGVAKRHRSVNPLRDGSVRAVGYDDDLYGSPGRGGAATIHSVVIKETGEEFRLAQSEEPDFGAELERQLEEPFGAEELPPRQDDPLGDGMGDGLDDLGPMDDLGPLDDLEPSDDFDSPNDRDAIDDEMPTLPADDGFSNEPPAPDSFGGPADPDPLSDIGDAFDEDDEGDSREEADARRLSKQRTQASQDCASELAELKAKHLSTVDVYIGVSGVEGKDYPFNCSIDDGTPFEPRCWAPVTYMWKASALCHKPLYFEQKAVERYGHAWGPALDPIVAGAHFFTRLPALPYCMGLKAPNECVYALGHYRPGSCAPYLIEKPGVTKRAILFSGAAWTGGVFAIP